MATKPTYNRAFVRVSVTLVLCLSGLSPAQEGAMEQAFARPPASARPHTWWHWMNGNVSRQGITADLEAMQRVGIGGCQAFHVTDGVPPGPAGYMSQAWLDLMKHAIREADRLGLEVCLHNCAGWSSSGGPWITPEYAMQQIVYTEKRIQGPASFSGELGRPKATADYYRDIAVLAFPTPETEKADAKGFRIADWKAKAGFERMERPGPDTRAVDAGDVIPLDLVTDLTGRRTWEVPAGDWTIVRFGYTPTGATNRPAPAEGQGLECDKLRREAARFHWSHSMQRIIDAVGPLAGKTFNNVLIDSYEVGQQNWTCGFEDRFRAQGLQAGPLSAMRDRPGRGQPGAVRAIPVGPPQDDRGPVC